MIRFDYGADSIVWIEEGNRLYASLIRLSRKRTLFSGFFIRFRFNRVLILRPEYSRRFYIFRAERRVE